MRKTTFIATVAVIATATVQAKTVEFNWTLGLTTANPDGLHERPVISVNGQWPIPPLKVNYGDTVVLNVNNNLNDVTAIHAHGLYQNGTSDQDGAVGVSECGIPPGHQRTYNFIANPSGTYWIHSHYKGQYMDGLRTAFIIEEPTQPYYYDEEFIVTMSDWYHNTSAVNLAWYLSKQNLEGNEPEPSSALINDSMNSTFKFEPNKTYRLRLINMSGMMTFFYSIDDHELEVIEVDGDFTQKYKASSVYLTAAQRMSVLVRTKPTTDKNYYMHALMDKMQLDSKKKVVYTNVTAAIYYDESHNNFAPIAENTKHAGYKAFDDFNLRSLYSGNAVNPDASYNVTVEDQIATDGLNRGMINRYAYIKPLVPSLNTMLTTGANASNPKVYGQQTNAFLTRHLDMIELVINNYDNDAHPFHLHGHKFQVVARGVQDSHQYYHGDPSSISWQLDSPLVRDTVRAPGYTYTIIRYRADNPGAWFFHCHIDFHLYSGMASVMIEAPEVAQQRMAVHPKIAEQCPLAGMSAYGNAAGKEGLDLEGAPHGIHLPDGTPLETPDDS